MQILLLHQQILLETERLRDLHRSIMSHSSPVPAAEMENLLQEIRNLYSLALQLNNENALQLLNEIQMAANKQILPFSKSSLLSSENSEPFLSKKPEEIQVDVPEDTIPEVVQPPVSNISEKHPEKKHLVSDIHEMFHDAPTIAKRFSDHQTLAEKIAGNGSLKRVSDNQKTSVKDIKSAIGLNEKFQFINQLFNGDAKCYHSVIDELNKSSSIDIALNSIKEISDSNNWESHPASAKSFIEIVERRFSS